MHLFSSKGICILSDKALWRSMKDQQRGHKGQRWTMGLFFIKRSLCFVVAFLRHSLKRVHRFCSVRHEIKLCEDSVTLGQNVLARTATETQKDTRHYLLRQHHLFSIRYRARIQCVIPRLGLFQRLKLLCLLDRRCSELINAPSVRPKTMDSTVWAC